jgi:uncharacterized protein YecT (DUF1311 family)
MLNWGANHDQDIDLFAAVVRFVLLGTVTAPVSKSRERALTSQLQKEGKDCIGATDNLSDRACISEVAQQTEKNLTTFYQNLRALLDSANRNNLERAQQQWLAYRTSSCNAIGELFHGGSARPGLIARCEIQLARSRMKDLHALYNLPLHH